MLKKKSITASGKYYQQGEGENDKIRLLGRLFKRTINNEVFSTCFKFLLFNNHLIQTSI